MIAAAIKTVKLMPLFIAAPLGWVKKNGSKLWNLFCLVFSIFWLGLGNYALWQIAGHWVAVVFISLMFWVQFGLVFPMQHSFHRGWSMLLDAFYDSKRLRTLHDQVEERVRVTRAAREDDGDV